MVLVPNYVKIENIAFDYSLVLEVKSRFVRNDMNKDFLSIIKQIFLGHPFAPAYLIHLNINL